MTFTTRFAPSPTGPLHLGHAYSALLAHDMARATGGLFLLRIEDIDQTRSKPDWERQILDDLTWLGVRWDAPPMRQSDRGPAYEAALDALWARGLLYACHCTRRDIAAAASAPQEGAEVPVGPDGPIYPGTCRVHAQSLRNDLRQHPKGMALRLNMARASMVAEQSPHNIKNNVQGIVKFQETGFSPLGQTGVIKTSSDILNTAIGDVVLSRRDFVGSYHLSVVLDDATQGITHVIRGQDLFDATPIHVVLQRLLGLPSPTYHHHRLIRDDHGKRLAKRDDARAISTYRAAGFSPDDIRAKVGL